MPDPKFLEIPLHLLSTILAKLECMQSLGAAILSHSSIYAAFHEDAKHIVQCILRSQIPAELMHYAAAAFESSINDNSVRRMGLVLLAAAFNNQFRPENGPPFQKWCLDWMFDHSLSGIGVRAIFARSHSWDIPEYDALDANTIASMFSKTHAVVEHFCSRFLAERLPLWQGLRGQLRPGNGCPSEKELLRIKRALYLFQIYCNMNFPHGGGFETTEEARDIQAQYVKCYILGSFSPWVNEQLACVHDFLEEVLSASFDEVAAHDIHWGAESVDWLAQGREGEHKQAYVSPPHRRAVGTSTPGRNTDTQIAAHIRPTIPLRARPKQDLRAPARAAGAERPAADTDSPRGAPRGVIADLLEPIRHTQQGRPRRQGVLDADTAREASREEGGRP